MVLETWYLGSGIASLGGISAANPGRSICVVFEPETHPPHCFIVDIPRAVSFCFYNHTAGILMRPKFYSSHLY